MQKVLLDTNFYMNHSDELDKFELIYLPLVVQEEIDHLKENASPIKSYKARQASRAINNANNIKKIPNNYSYTGVYQIDLDMNRNDNKIIQIAKSLSTNGVTLVTSDLNMVFKAECLEIPVIYWKEHNIELYSGIKYIEADDEADISEITNKINKSELLNNQFVLIGKWVYNEEFDQNQFKARESLKYQNGFLESVRSPRLGEKLNDCFREDYEQKLIYDAISDEKIDILIVFGEAGSGKDYTVLANCLNNVSQPQTNKKGKYRSKKILYTRNIVESAEKLGYLPGTENEKISPYMNPARQNIDKILNTIGLQEDYETLIKNKQYMEQSLSFMRGCTYDNTYLIYDEAANSEIENLKMFISRCGENSKAIILGSLNQIDNKNNSSENNGLFKLINLYKNQKNCAIIQLRNQHRSYLARQADQLIK